MPKKGSYYSNPKTRRCKTGLTNERMCEGGQDMSWPNQEVQGTGGSGQAKQKPPNYGNRFQHSVNHYPKGK
jgi:hypothetical protein